MFRARHALHDLPIAIRRYGVGLILAAVWIAPLRAQETTGTIRGRVTDRSSQLPLRGATVRLGGATAETRVDGAYLLTGVPARERTRCG